MPLFVAGNRGGYKIKSMVNDVQDSSERRQKGSGCSGGISGGVYGVALIGAAIYYIQHADTFRVGVIGVLKALVWPAFLVYELFGFLGM